MAALSPATSARPRTPRVEDLFGGSLISPVPDPYPTWCWLRRESPVSPIESAMGVTWYVTRYDDVVSVLRNPVLFSTSSNAFQGRVIGRTILEMDGKEHLRHRRTIAPKFVPRYLMENLPAVIRKPRRSRVA